MNDFEAASTIGYVVRKMHVHEMTAEEGSRMTLIYMADPVCSTVVQQRINTAISTNQETIRQAQIRNAELVALRTLLCNQ